MGAQIKEVCEAEKPQKLDLLPQSTISYLKYRFWLPKFLSMASSEPMPRYFFSLIPSEKKYSPGASVVAARREPIITSTRDHQEQHVSSRKAVAAKPSGSLGTALCWIPPMPPATCRYMPSCPESDAIWKPFLGDSLQRAQCVRPMRCSPVEAPSARAFAMCPTVWIPPSAITGTPNLLAYSDTLYTAVAWGRPHASTAGGERAEKGSAPTQQRVPSPAGPFRLPAHTCSSTRERTNPWMLLP